MPRHATICHQHLKNAGCSNHVMIKDCESSAASKGSWKLPPWHLEATNGLSTRNRLDKLCHKLYQALATAGWLDHAGSMGPQLSSTNLTTHTQIWWNFNTADHMFQGIFLVNHKGNTSSGFALHELRAMTGSSLVEIRVQLQSITSRPKCVQFAQVVKLCRTTEFLLFLTSCMNFNR